MNHPNSFVLDDIPRPLWIVMMILGFIFFWPVGLAILGYMIWTKKMRVGGKDDWHAFKMRSGLSGTTGNKAFDDYREETLRRMDEEAREFQTFVDQLRKARDREEFERYMSQRGSRGPSVTPGQTTF